MPEVISIFDVEDYDEQIARGASTLRGGGIVVLPTETVYGAAGVLSQENAKSRLLALRSSAEKRPFTVHLADSDHALKFIDQPTELGLRMMRKLWPGPVALVFKVSETRRAEVAQSFKLAESDIYDGEYMTLRCPDHIVATEVLGQVDGPVGLIKVDSDPWNELDDKVDLVYDAGPTKYSKPSTIVRVDDDRYEIVREGVYDQRIIERLLRTTILFVCSGNTCRSPMAEAIARKQIAIKLSANEEDLEKKKGIIVMSAGSFAMPGARATPQAVEALKELGVDLTRHRSRPLSVELIHQADWIFTMGRSHRAAIAVMVPAAVQKTTTLSPDGDIDDPIGGDLALYQALARQLSGYIDQRVVEKVAS